MKRFSTATDSHTLTANSPAHDCPTLAGKRLTLEPLIAAHAAAMFPLLADEELWQYTDDRPPLTVDALCDRYRRLEARRSPDGTQLWLNWAVMVPQFGIVGFVQATVPKQSRAVEVAFVIAKRFWSLGLGTEAVHVLITFLQEKSLVNSVRATVDERNGASLRLLHKLGFELADASDTRNLRLQLSLAAPKMSLQDVAVPRT